MLHLPHADGALHSKGSGGRGAGVRVSAARCGVRGGTVLPTFDDPEFARRLTEAARATGARRYLVYRKLDADLVRNGAPLVAFGNEVDHDFFSARMGCQIYNPAAGGIDLAALCIRKR